MDPEHKVYDDHDEQPVTGPDLHALETGEKNSEESPRKRKSGKAKSKGTLGSTGGLYQDDKGSPVSGTVADALGGAEAGQDNIKFNPFDTNDRGNFRLVLKAAGRHKKSLLIGGGATTGIVGLVVVIFLMLIPLKIEHIVTNLEKRFTSTSQDAVENATERMLSVYIKKHVLPALTKCSGTTLDRNCNPHFGNSNNPVDALYKGWSDARLENKLATNYGIEFKAVKHGSVVRYYMKGPGLGNPNGDDITKFVTDTNLADGDLFQQVSRGDARQYVRDAFQNETRWKKVMFRFKVGRLLEEKYGITRCIVFCSKRDALRDFTDQKQNAAKLYLTQRVIVPRTESLGIVMECLLNPSCTPEKTEPTIPEDGQTAESSGAPENADTDTRVRTSLEELAAQHGIEDSAAIKKMIEDYNNASDKGYQNYVLKKILEKIGLGELSGNIADKAFIVGWVNKAADTIVTLKKAGPSVKKLQYITNASAAASLYMMYRTYADEIHTGHVDAKEVGSFTKSLSSGNHGNPSDPIVGGTASAESAPLYGEIMGDNAGSFNSALMNPLLPSTYAAASDAPSNDYRCNDGKPPSGVVCKEEKFGGGNETANEISSRLSAPPLSYISAVAGAWHGVVGGIIGFVGNIFGSVIGHIPGVDSLSSFVSSAVQPFFNFLTNQLIHNPFGTNMSGARTFDMVAAGANVTGNDACEQIGCQNVSTATAANIINQQLAEDRLSFEKRPLFARMFSTDTQYSLVSRIALATPFSTQASISGALQSPLTSLAHSFSSLFAGPKIMAASESSVDPFSIGTTAFPADKIPADPEKYWDEHNCGDTSANGPIAKWQKAAADAPTNPKTGMPMHMDVEPCLLIKHAVGDAGAIYDTGLLTTDEQQVLGNVSSTTSTQTSTSSGSLPGGSAKDLANQLLPFISQGKIKCGSAAGGSGPADCLDIQNTAKGVSIGGSCAVDSLQPHLLGLILGLVRDDHWTLGISSICSNHHPEGDGPYGGHSHGSTADFSIENGVAGAGAASNEKFVDDIAKLLSEAGGSFGQVGECHPIYDSQKSSKFVTFADRCNHQHVRAAP